MTMKQLTALLLALLLTVCSPALAEEETFRNGKVLDAQGGATVWRSNMEMPVYVQMVVQSGDRMETTADGWVVLCLDEDKYLILEPETKASFQLEGNSRRGMIRIHLHQGAIYSEIENPLNDADGYEITTPDGVMAVRGTNFRASHQQQGQMSQTNIQLFFGELAISTSDEISRQGALTEGQQTTLTTPLDENGEPVGETELGDPEPLNLDGLPEAYDLELLQEPEALFGQETDGDATLCEACGQEIVRPEDHQPIQSESKYCTGQHYRCTGTLHPCDPSQDHNPEKDGIQGGCGGQYYCRNAGNHTLCRMCGDLWCNYSQGGHQTPCGNPDHRPCQLSGYRISDHQVCPWHCGGHLCNGRSHGTGEGQCNYVPPVSCSFCGAIGSQHSAVACGAHCVNQSGDHDLCFHCATPYCNGWAHHSNCDDCYNPSEAAAHASCPECDWGYVCWEGHGVGCQYAGT